MLILCQASRGAAVHRGRGRAGALLRMQGIHKPLLQRVQRQVDLRALWRAEFLHPSSGMDLYPCLCAYLYCEDLYIPKLVPRLVIYMSILIYAFISLSIYLSIYLSISSGSISQHGSAPASGAAAGRGGLRPAQVRSFLPSPPLYYHMLDCSQLCLMLRWCLCIFMCLYQE
jgi:hypothetical protein